MKFDKICNWWILLMLLFMGCAKDSLDTIPVEDVWGEYSSRIDSLRDVIIGTSTGWEFRMENKALAQSYIGYLGFEGLNSSFAVDYNLDFATLGETTYSLEVRKSNPTLSFGSMSGFTDFAVQAASIDTTYSYKYSYNDTLYFLGDIYANEFKLVPASTRRQAYFRNEGLISFVQLKQFLRNAPRFFFNVTYGDKNFFFYKNEIDETVVFHYFQGDEVVFHKSSFELTLDHLKLTTPLVIEDQQIEEFTNPRFESGELVFDEGKVINSVAPSFYVSGANDFLRLNANDEHGFGNWLSWYGWSQRNQIDIVGLKAWRGDFQILFRYGNGTGAAFNRIGMAYFDGGWFWWGGDYAVFHAQSNGVLYFLRNSDFNYAAANNATVTNMQLANLSYFTNASGYYVIHTIDDQIVLVDTGSAESWIFYK